MVTVDNETTMWVLHSPYPDGTWRGTEKCLGSEHGDILLFYSRDAAAEYRDAVLANHFRPVRVTLTVPAVGSVGKTHPRWRWMPGMAYTRRGKVHRVDGDLLASGGSYDETCIPDLTDPATLGCLLSLVREAWADPTASTAATRESDGIGWVMDCWDPRSPLHGLGPFGTEAEALIAALEAAP